MFIISLKLKFTVKLKKKYSYILLYYYSVFNQNNVQNIRTVQVVII